MKWHFLIISFFYFQFVGSVNRSQLFRWKPVYPPADSLVYSLEIKTYDGQKYDKRIPLVKALYALAETHPHLPVLKSRALYWHARLLIAKSNIDSACNLIRSGVCSLDTSNYRYDYERFLSLRASIDLIKGNWSGYYGKMKRLEAYYEKEKDFIMLASTYINIGNYLKDIGENRWALNYLSKADSLYAINSLDKYQIKNHLNLSNVLYLTGQKEKAIYLLANLLKESEAQADTIFYINVLFSIYNQTKDLKQSGEYAEKAYRLASILKNDFLQAKAAVAKGENMYKKNNKDEALIYFKQAVAYAEYSNNYDFILNALEGIISIYSSYQKWDSAFIYQQKYVSIRDSLNTIKNIFIVKQMEAQLAQKKYEAELILAEKEIITHKRMNVFIVTLGLLLLLFVGYVYETLRNKEKIKRQLKESENREISVRLKNEQLRNEHFQLKIDIQHKELVANSLMISEKNRLLNNLLSRIKMMGKDGHISPQSTTELIRQIEGDLIPGNDWMYFKLHFEKIHPAFFSKLKETCSNLSEGELHLCAYIRSGIENKQIVQLLSVQPDTIKTTRYRIRRKLKLRQEDSLEDFLRSV